jgi:cytochrome c oxidase subunit 3
MMSIHAIHLTIGVILVIIVTVRAWRGALQLEHSTGVEKLGSCWYSVDIIWLFLLPLLYLIARH